MDKINSTQRFAHRWRKKIWCRTLDQDEPIASGVLSEHRETLDRSFHSHEGTLYCRIIWLLIAYHNSSLRWNSGKCFQKSKSIKEINFWNMPNLYCRVVILIDWREPTDISISKRKEQKDPSTQLCPSRDGSMGGLHWLGWQSFCMVFRHTEKWFPWYFI